MLPQRTWFSLNRVEESLAASQVKKQQTSARRPGESKGDQPVPCDPWLTEVGGGGGGKAGLLRVQQLRQEEMGVESGGSLGPDNKQLLM